MGNLKYVHATLTEIWDTLLHIAGNVFHKTGWNECGFWEDEPNYQSHPASSYRASKPASSSATTARPASSGPVCTCCKESDLRTGEGLTLNEGEDFLAMTDGDPAGRPFTGRVEIEVLDRSVGNRKYTDGA